jgi:aryl-alcohol dehydrogenase-like predicted oxidoreductase
MMKRNRLGSSDLMVSEIGFGCMSIGTDEKRAISLIHKAMELGINFFDTADLYEYGKNEEIVGKAIKGRRSEVILATKVGNRRVPGKEGWIWDPSKEYIKSAVKESLKRLQTDYIDLYQLHGGTIEDPIDETIEAFEELKQEGLIRYYGISSIRPNVIREYVKRSNIVSVMSQYSILDRRPEEETMPLIKKHHISLIARGPVAQGRLSDLGEAKLQEGYLDYSSEELRLLVKDLRSLVNDQRSLEHLAIRYALADPVVATVIPGASTIEQLIQNVKASQTPLLTQQEIERIKALSKANQYTLHR